MLSTLLGLEPDAFAKRLRIVRPLLPELVNRLDVQRLAVGEAKVDLRFRRTSEQVVVDILRVDGDLDVVVEHDSTEMNASQPATAPSAAPADG
jgi:hypothetical protein